MPEMSALELGFYALGPFNKHWKVHTVAAASIAPAVPPAAKDTHCGVSSWLLFLSGAFELIDGCYIAHCEKFTRR